MLSILDTSHSSIGPCGPSEQSPFGNASTHASTASLSSWSFENAGGGGGDALAWEANHYGLVLHIVRRSWTKWWLMLGIKVYIIRDRVTVVTRLGCALAYAPLHGFGDILMRSIKNRNQRREGKPIWVHWCCVNNVCRWTKICLSSITSISYRTILVYCCVCVFFCLLQYRIILFFWNIV